MAICSPLLEDIDIEGATGILINITAGNMVKLNEIRSACEIVQEAAHEDANIIFGAVIDESLGDEMRVTVIATGFPADKDDDLDQGSLEKRSKESLNKLAQIARQPLNNDGLPSATVPSSTDIVPLSITPRIDRDLDTTVTPTQEASPPMRNFKETQELAQWTLDHSISPSPALADSTFSFDLENPTENQVDQTHHFGDAYEPLSQNSTTFIEETKRGAASVISDPNDDFINSFVDQLNNMMSDAKLDDTILLSQEPAKGTHQVDAEEFSPMREGATIGTLAADSMKFGTNDAHLFREFDDKIDDVMAFNDRINAIQKQSDQDDLDIPAFLRHGNPNLNLE
jgi:hypothetical protein